jgi:protein-arginine kinase activator protein McsA
VDKCLKCESEDLKIGITNTQSGSTIYPVYCNQCGDVSNKYIKKHVALEYAITNGPLEYVETNTAKWMKEKQQQIKCEVCDINEGELHHWAPQYLFQDADSWPKSYLCRACHRKWHDLVTPNMSNKK